MNVLMRMGSLSDWVYLDKVSHSNIILPKHISWYSFSDPRSSFNWSIKSLTFASLWRINFNFLVSLRTLHVISMLCFWSSASWSTVFVSMNLKLYFLKYPALHWRQNPGNLSQYRNMAQFQNAFQQCFRDRILIQSRLHLKNSIYAIFRWPIWVCYVQSHPKVL